MTRERTKELLPILQAWVEGRTIQARRKDKSEWLDVSIAEPVWWDDFDYRIKPREWDVVIRNGKILTESFPIGAEVIRVREIL